MVKIPQYFEKIPEWDARNIKDSFKVFDDLSPLPITRLEHWRHFQQFIEKYYDGELSRDLIFRGQRRYDWKLISSLKRAKNPNSSLNLEGKQLKEFKKSIRGRIQDHSLLKEKLDIDEKNELWSIGQHHGLMTPLLDWTYSPYVALFFAFIEEDTIEEILMPNDYRSVYILDSVYFKEIIKNSNIHIFEPNKDEYGRLVNQDGLFTISPIDIDIETEISNSVYKYLEKKSKSTEAYNIARIACKVYIKNIDREECLKHLDCMNVNHKSLFPDLHGSAYFCNNQIANFEYNFQKAAMNGGSLMRISVEENNKYDKFTLCEDIENILTEKLNNSLSKGEKKKIEEIDIGIKKVFTRKPIENAILVPQIKILAGEIAIQIERLKKLPITELSYEILMRAKIDLIFRKFNFKYLEPIQSQKAHVIDEIMVLIKKQNDEE